MGNTFTSCAHGGVKRRKKVKGSDINGRGSEPPGGRKRRLGKSRLGLKPKTEAGALKKKPSKKRRRFRRKKNNKADAVNSENAPEEALGESAWRVRTRDRDDSYTSDIFFDAEEDLYDSDASTSYSSDGEGDHDQANAMPEARCFSWFDYFTWGLFSGQPSEQLDPPESGESSSSPPPAPSGGFFSFLWPSFGGRAGTGQEGRGEDILVPQKSEAPWEVRLRSLSRQSRELDIVKPPTGTIITQASMPFELSRERGLLPDRMSWDNPRMDSFLLRTKSYLSTKKKCRGEGRPLYQLRAVDIYRSEVKVNNVAERIKLPSTERIPEDCPFPPLLVVNWQLPMYPARIWGPFDGPGINVVNVFSLEDGFDVDRCLQDGDIMPHTIELLKLFMQDAALPDGSYMRDRLKLVPSVPNLNEWCATNTFNRAEQKLLRRYNTKPMLARPQFCFTAGPDYLEIDIDIHQYLYLTRRYFEKLKGQIKNGILDMALVIEGRCPEELPEEVVAGLRLQNIDLLQPYPYVPPRPKDHLTRAGTGEGGVDAARKVSLSRERPGARYEL